MKVEEFIKIYEDEGIIGIRRQFSLEKTEEMIKKYPFLGIAKEENNNG